MIGVDETGESIFDGDMVEVRRGAHKGDRGKARRYLGEMLAVMLDHTKAKIARCADVLVIEHAPRVLMG